jgi:3-hydroxyacyl-CoA dehydrogenase
VNQSVLIAGTGKMGRNIGSFFLGKGFRVCWFSRSSERIDDIRSFAQKQYNRLIKSTDITTYEPEFACTDDPGKINHFDICIESIEESRDAKIALLDFLYKQFSISYLFSNSSSFLPSQLHQRCLGLHFFYPLQLHPCAELIVNNTNNFESIVKVLAQTHLNLFSEDNRSAFAINRLLLPVQVETICMLHEGFSLATVDNCSCSSLLAMGQVRMMHSIGSEILVSSVKNYQQITTEFERKHIEILLDGIKMLSLPGVSLCSQVDSQLKLRFLYLFINTCLYFIERSFLTENQINCALDLVFGAEESLNSVLEREGRRTIRDQLCKWYDNCRREYFVPSVLLE